MRYASEEETSLVGNFEPNSEVKIKIINALTDNLVKLKTDKCLESKHIPGVFLFRTNNIKDDALPTGKHYNLVYEMYTSDNKKFRGKFIYGGYVDKDVEVNLQPVIEKIEEVDETTQIINARI